MGKEDLQNNRVEKFVSEVMENEGKLIPLKDGYNVLYVTGKRDAEPDRTVHFLTLLRANGTGVVKPVGFATFDTQVNGSIQAKWAAASLIVITGEHSTLKTPRLLKDQKAEKIILPENNNFSFSVSGDDAPGLHWGMVPVAVDYQERHFGLGGFLLQLSSHMAKKFGADKIITPNKIGNDMTEENSANKESLFEKSLGAVKEFEPDSSWSLSLSHNLPTDYLEKFTI